MAVDPADVVAWLGGADAMAGYDETVLERVCAAVDGWADRHFDIPDTPNAEIEQGLIQEAGRRWSRKYSPDGLSGSGDLVPIRVPTWDPDAERALNSVRKTAGLFGPSENVVVEA